MAFGDFLFGSPARTQQSSRLNPSQQNLLRNINQTALGNLQGLSSNAFNFQPIEEQARRNFQGTTIPSIANRFAAQGATDGSGYRNAILGAGSDLESNLAALRAQYGIQNQGQMISLLQSLLGHGLGDYSDTIHEQPSGGFLGHALPALGAGLGSIFGGPVAGSAAGAGGSALASLLSQFYHGA